MKHDKAKFYVAAAVMAGAAAFVLTLSGAAMAEDGAKAAESYKVEDAPDSPPVNYRSNEDERYNTPEQHDAEMYAEQYEKQKEEKALKDKALLDSMNRASPNDTLNSAPGWPTK
ncbi:MAG: hypothetical protein ACOH12_01320 [Parvibaculaceae bacterium]